MNMTVQTSLIDMHVKYGLEGSDDLQSDAGEEEVGIQCRDLRDGEKAFKIFANMLRHGIEQDKAMQSCWTTRRGCSML